jgi:cellulose synthase/poly-beta-1,6-N-acetylglucosamine synthase-like glycosyltransferase
MASTLLNVLWSVLVVVISYNLVLPILFFIIYKLIRSNKSLDVQPAEPDYGIIVTAYEHTNTLSQCVASLLNLKYSNYMIYVVADKCDISNLHFADPRVVLMKPEEELRSNTRSHLYAIQHFKHSHELLTIIDSDNLVEPDYLNELNKQFGKGYSAVQGVRKPKNLNSLFACLDAAQDIYYHFYDREILFSIGSSSTLAGSGMAFSTKLYRSFLDENDIRGAGFDKVLQISILQKGYRIAFAKKAIVYDEKTSQPDQLIKQRARWFNTWFKYARLGLGLLVKGIKRGSLNQFLSGLMFLRPPLFLVLTSSIASAIISLFINPMLTVLLSTALSLFVLAFLVALIHSRADKRIYRSLVGVPVFIFFQFLALLKIKKANQISVATQHYYDKTIDEVNSQPGEI